jgi:hypothetical protein
MAHTRRRRQTKHRGNAAGVVEARGRTGRKPTAAEKGKPGRSADRGKLRAEERRERPPSWRRAFGKALAMSAVLLAILLVFNWGKPRDAFILAPIALLAYIPISYYTDTWVYRRRQATKAGGGRRGAAS